MNDDDYKLAERLQPLEIEELVRRYWHDVWQYAYFLTRQHHLAEDVAQETFVKAIRSIDSFRGQCPIKNWLLKIARNTALNAIRSMFLRKVSLVGLFVNNQTTSVPSAEATFWDANLTDEIWETVLQLPREQREILVLYAHYMWSYREISDLLEVGEGTVKSRLHRARAKLAKRMKERGDEDDG